MSAELQIVSTTAQALLDLRWQVLRVGRPRHTAAMPGDDAPTTQHWAATSGGAVLGCLTIMVADYPDGPGPTLRLRGMAVSASHQGQGIGGTLLDAVQARLAAPLWCDARVAAVPFYRAHGWQVRSDVYDVPAVGPHHRMTYTP